MLRGQWPRCASASGLLVTAAAGAAGAAAAAAEAAAPEVVGCRGILFSSRLSVAVPVPLLSAIAAMVLAEICDRPLTPLSVLTSLSTHFSNPWVFFSLSFGVAY